MVTIGDVRNEIRTIIDPLLLKIKLNTSINSLSNVGISAPSAGQTIIFDGEKWVNVSVNLNIESGDSFPDSPEDETYFFRTDLGLLCLYDGSSWKYLDLSDYMETADYDSDGNGVLDTSAIPTIDPSKIDASSGSNGHVLSIVSSVPTWTTVSGVGGGGVIVANPSDISIGDETEESLTITWSGYSSHTAIYRSENVSGTYNKIAVVCAADESYTDTGLSTSTTYWYKLKNVVGDSESSLSTAVSSTTLGGPVSDLTPVIFLDAHDSTFTTENGNRIIQWSDVSGNSKHATASTGSSARPYLVSDGAHFDGVYNYLTIPSLWSDLSNGTFVLIGRCATIPADNRAFAYNNDGVYVLMRLGVSGNKFEAYVNDNVGAKTLHSSEDTYSTWIFVFTVSEGNTINGWVNGKPMYINGTSVGTFVVVSGTGRTIGAARNASGAFFSGTLCHVSAYTRVLNTSERNQLENWASRKYSVIL